MIKKNSTRKDLSNKIYQKLGFSKNLSSIIVDDFFESLTTELIKTKKVDQSDLALAVDVVKILFRIQKKINK